MMDEQDSPETVQQLADERRLAYLLREERLIAQQEETNGLHTA